MTMKSRLPHSLFWTLTSLFLLVAAACGPAGEPQPATEAETASAVEAEEETAGKVETTSETGAASGATSTAIVDETTVATDSNGIEVGFTEDGRPYRGDPDAPVVLEEFSDYQCPFCGRFASQTLPSLLENQIAAGDVMLVFYDFPLTAIHPQAIAAANAARCAGNQGAVAYWEMHDALFANPREWSQLKADEVFVSYAQTLELDVEAFRNCVEADTYVEDIQDDLALGRSRGVSSTPSFFLNEQMLIGAQPTNVFNDAIAAVKNEEQIAGANAPATESSAPESPAAVPTPVTIPMDDVAGTLGDPNAEVTIVEYTDYQCPFCARHATQTAPQLIRELVDTGRVYYVIKDLPLDNLHPNARAAAIAARCAGEQEAYWEMHDALFENQDQWAETADPNPTFTNIAADLGLDESAYTACLQSDKYDAVIQANVDEAAQLGMTGTPAFFIDGFPVRGAQPFDLFTYAVELAEAGELAEAYRPREEQQQQAPPEPSGPVDVPLEDVAFALGAPDAPVTIVEYTDYQCPFCGRHATQTFPRIKENFIDTGMVYYVFKDFPLTNIHPQAPKAAEAARCAGEQDAYMDMHDTLFAAQSQWSNGDDTSVLFTGYADQLGLDTAAFSECLNSDKYADVVSANQQEGIELGVRGTPGFFLNGHYVSGAQPYELFDQAITQLAAEAEN